MAACPLMGGRRPAAALNRQRASREAARPPSITTPAADVAQRARDAARGWLPAGGGDYLKAGWSEPQLRDILARSGAAARDLLLVRGTRAEELGLTADDVSHDRHRRHGGGPRSGEPADRGTRPGRGAGAPWPNGCFECWTGLGPRARGLATSAPPPMLVTNSPDAQACLKMHILHLLLSANSCGRVHPKHPERRSDRVLRSHACREGPQFTRDLAALTNKYGVKADIARLRTALGYTHSSMRAAPVYVSGVRTYPSRRARRGQSAAARSYLSDPGQYLVAVSAVPRSESQGWRTDAQRAVDLKTGWPSIWVPWVTRSARPSRVLLLPAAFLLGHGLARPRGAHTARACPQPG